MLNGGVGLQLAETIAPDQSSPASAMAGLFAPMHRLLVCGGDPRLAIDPASGLNEYGCQPHPCPETLSFSSSTASSISQRAWDRAEISREALMRSAIDMGIEEAFDARVEAMREELRAALSLPQAAADIVFSPSGTDAQLQALFLSQARLGRQLTTVVVAADQTGSGTIHTARGCHFSAATANGSRVRKGEPIEGLSPSVESVALPLFDTTGQARPPGENDRMVFDAVERALNSGSKVLLQVMDASKFGWRAPSDQCLEAIATRWGNNVQIVVDACQMRLGRARLKKYLDRGYMVLITGSKFFTGPPFSGALLVPACFAGTLDLAADVAPGLFEYTSRSDWPKSWAHLRARFPAQMNFGQWLRWEAAIEEIAAYYRLPGEFRELALATFGRAVENLIAISPSLELLAWQQRPADADDEEFAQRTIFSFVVRRGDRICTLEECRALYRALAGTVPVTSSVTARSCLIGQPVALGGGPAPGAALRISTSARLVSEAWSSDPRLACANLQRLIGDVGTAIASLERLHAQMAKTGAAETVYTEASKMNAHSPLDGLARYPSANRIGFAALTKMAFDGADLRPLRDQLVRRLAEGTAGAGDGLDLSLIVQLLGDKATGLAIQAEVLGFHQLYRSPCASKQPRLRVLALAAAIDMGGNTPIEFLLENSAVELQTLYVVDGVDLPTPLPEHDVAIVVASDSDECAEALRKIEAMATRWPRPLLNPPHLVRNLDRDKLYRRLTGVTGLEMPVTLSVTRAQLMAIANGDADIAAFGAMKFPLILRPRGSHAGVGLAKVDDAAAIARCLGDRVEQEFFVAPFVDYSSPDGLFRKYRIVFIEGKPYACHMAIAERWDIWYLNAGMTFDAGRRSEEARFMRDFESDFALRHASALAATAERIGLDYFTIDCAESRSGALLIFEADNTAVVHNMDSPDLFPYKPPQMRKVFDAFAAMMYRAGSGREQAA